MDAYSITLLKAVNEWLSYDPKERLACADRLLKELENVGPEFKQCTVECYRRIDFPKDPNENPRDIPLPLLDLLHTGNLAESVTSWTTDLQVAKDHLEGVQAGATCVIFRHLPLAEEVWLNLSDLLKAPAFQNALKGTFFPAIQRWMGREKEVILEVKHITPEHVCAWGSIVGNLDQLKEAAAAEGMSPDEIRTVEPELRKKAKQEWWLSLEPSKALALRMQEFARTRYNHPIL